MLTINIFNVNKNQEEEKEKSEIHQVLLYQLVFERVEIEWDGLYQIKENLLWRDFLRKQKEIPFPNFLFISFFRIQK